MIEISIVIAYLFDLSIGDPAWLPHPVRGIGFLISSCESLLINLVTNKRLGGIVLLFAIVALTYLFARLILTLLALIHPLAYFLGESILIFFSFSIHDMKKESMNVYRALQKKDISCARVALSRIVGRDTKSLTEDEVVRGAVESVSESIVDGIIAPLFFAALGGAPFAMVYRAVNTLDSMVGYNDDRYREFGWFSAKVDDLLNYVPARIAGYIIIPIAAFWCEKNWALSFLTVVNDAGKHPSPNSGFPEAAVAGALEVQLGGVNSYHGVRSERLLIGQPYRHFHQDHILEVNKLMLVTSFVFLVSLFLSLFLF